MRKIKIENFISSGQLQSNEHVFLMVDLTEKKPAEIEQSLLISRAREEKKLTLQTL